MHGLGKNETTTPQRWPLSKDGLLVASTSEGSSVRMNLFPFGKVSAPTVLVGGWTGSYLTKCNTYTPRWGESLVYQRSMNSPRLTHTYLTPLAGRERALRLIRIPYI